MSRMFTLCALVALSTLLPAFAQEQSTEDVLVTGTLEVPAQVTLTNGTISTTSLIKVANEDRYIWAIREGNPRELGTSRIQLAVSPADVRFDDGALKFTWLPASLYVFPLVKTATFTKTGAAEVTVSHDVKENVTDESTRTTASTIHTVTTETVRTTTRAVTVDPQAKTTYTYNSYALYGVITANANHIFDWRDNPLQTENARVGVGLLWARQRDITQGVAFDRNHASSSDSTAPSAAVRVKTHGFEVSRSISGGDPTWYFSYVTSWQD